MSFENSNEIIRVENIDTSLKQQQQEEMSENKRNINESGSGCGSSSTIFGSNCHSNPVVEENERLEHENQEIHEIYKQRGMEFQKKDLRFGYDPSDSTSIEPTTGLMRKGSLLNLKKQGIVKEISQKFQTPDTASYTRSQTGTANISIKDKIALLKKEQEKRKQENELQQREKVIVLSTDTSENQVYHPSVLIDKMNNKLDEVAKEKQEQQQQQVEIQKPIITPTASTTIPIATPIITSVVQEVKIQQPQQQPKVQQPQQPLVTPTIVTQQQPPTKTSSPKTKKNSDKSSKSSNKKEKKSSSTPSTTTSSPLPNKDNNNNNNTIVTITSTNDIINENRKRRGRVLVTPSSDLQKNIQIYFTIPSLNSPPSKINNNNNNRPSNNQKLLLQPTQQFLKSLILESDPNLKLNELVSGTTSNIDTSSDDSNTNTTTTIPSTSLLNVQSSLRVKAIKTSFEILFLMPNQSKKILLCKGTDSIDQLKERLINEYLSNVVVNNSKVIGGSGGGSSADSYLILDFNDNPLEKSLTLNKCDYILDKRAQGLIPKLKVIEKSTIIDSDPSGEISPNEYEIIRKLIPSTNSWRGEEVEYFRRVTSRLRYDSLPLIKGSIQSTLLVRLSPLPIPIVVNKILISVFLPITQVTKTLDLELNETADQFTNRLFIKNYSKHLPNVGASDFILKVVGSSDYIHGSYDIRTFEAIRNHIIQGTKPQLTLIQRPKPELDPPPFKPRFDYPPELPIIFNDTTTTTTTTTDSSSNSSLNTNWDQLTHISIREIKKPFKVKVLGSTRIPTSCVKDDDSYGVIVSISLYHGIECFSKVTTSVITPPPFAFLADSLSIDWCEWLIFNNIDYSNIPIDARLSISVYSTKCNNNSDDNINNINNLNNLNNNNNNMNGSNGISNNNNSNNNSNSNNNNNNGDDEESNNDKNQIPIGWINVMISDFKYQLRQGVIELSLWPNEFSNPLGTCSNNPSSNQSIGLTLEFEEFNLPVIFSRKSINNSSSSNNNTSSNNTNNVNRTSLTLELTSQQNQQQQQVQPIVQQLLPLNEMREFFESISLLDPLSDLKQEKYNNLWAFRHYAIQFPTVLPRLMLSVPWTQASAVDEAIALLDRWPKIKPYEALELLDAKHANRKVREFAVSCLEDLSEDELLDILLQLVQVLKYEPFHDSKLSRFLLKKAILNRNIGHSFFWYLKSDLHVSNLSERFGILLESYLYSCGAHRYELLKQMEVINNLTEVAKKIKPLKDQDRREFMIKEFESLEWPKRFHLTLNPRFESNGLIINKCKYMDSKKLPLRLSFTNTDMNADPIEVIFKAGDDLRQDMLTLQMIRLMDKLWQKEGLDLKLSPYGCISTGDMIGMIEVVLNSETTARIQKSAGGGATAAFKLDPLANWLMQHNKTESEYQKAVDNFILSCAGYCVATYVLGIGDRHNDNLMCTRGGRLFHIDFGHFLGNYKKKFGFKRERAPFVFTPDFCFVMGGKESFKFSQFVNYCCTAYNIVRKNARLFMNLFAMMVSTGIPELQSMDDLQYLKESFSLELSDEKAREKFVNLIHESLTTKTTQVNNMIHLIAH